MKKSKLLPFALALLVGISCQKQNPPQSVEVNEEAVANEAVTPEKATDSVGVTGLACDKGYEINISWPDGPQSEKMKAEVLKDGGSEIIEMKNVPAASGAKYEAQNGAFLWNKGKDWMYGKGDETYCGCTEK